MSLQRIAAFSDGNQGGNPAGVSLTDALPSASDMQRIASEVGFSETAFAAPEDDGFRVRYFSPESEVPFCGHATIALGAALASEQGDGVYRLSLNEARITVEANSEGNKRTVALQSPPTHSEALDARLRAELLDLFGYSENDLNPEIPPAMIHGGANHAAIILKSRQALASMSYDLERGRVLMNDAKLVTVLLGYAESSQRFHTRNPFASGGVYEDPATGAATAALAGFLRDIKWPHGGMIDVVQGEDMGSRSLLKAEFNDEQGSSIRVSGQVRFMDGH